MIHQTLQDTEEPSCRRVTAASDHPCAHDASCPEVRRILEGSMVRLASLRSTGYTPVVAVQTFECPRRR